MQIINNQIVDMPLSFVKNRHLVRVINEKYLSVLIDKIKTLGVKAYPLSVTPGGLLFGGNHRYEAFTRLGIERCWMHISQPVSLDKEAIELNVASDGSLPMTFVDYAELVWRRVGEGMTQASLAGEIGWSREKVKDYAALQKISPAVWDAIGATFRDISSVRENDVAPSNGAVALFTENLLRHITDLAADQQLELVRCLVRGKDGRGHNFTKRDFREQADKFKAYNSLVTVATERLKRETGVNEYSAKATEELSQVWSSLGLQSAHVQVQYWLANNTL